MSHNVHIGRVRTRPRLLPSSLSTPQDIGNAVDHTLRDEMDNILASLSISTDSILCIRQLQLTLDLKNNLPTPDLRREWVQKITTTLADLLTRRDSTIVLFRSARELVMDMAVGIVVGDFQRRWAWQRSGLLPSGMGTADPVEDIFVATLIEQSASDRSLGQGGIVAILVELAHRGMFAELWERLTENHRSQLLQAALSSYKHPAMVGQPIGLSTPPESATLRWAQSIDWSHSSLLGSTTPRLLSTDIYNCYTLLVFALLEIDPLVLHRGARAVELALSYAPPEWLPTAPVAQTSKTTAPIQNPDIDTTAAQRPDTTQLANNDPNGTTLTPDSTVPATRGSSLVQPTTQSASDYGAAAHPDVNTAQRQHSDPDNTAVDRSHTVPQSDEVLRVDSLGTTDFGGLLYLLHAVRTTGIMTTWLADETFSGRDIRSWLLLLARSLVPALPPGDCAEMAFAGLAPTAHFPKGVFAPLTSAEQTALDGLRDTVQVWITTHVTAPTDDSSKQPAEWNGSVAIDWIVRRPARIVVEPGWIDVILSQQYVRTEIRRAGLDLNPGYLPWLGCVVRFIYE